MADPSGVRQPRAWRASTVALGLALWIGGFVALAAWRAFHPPEGAVDVTSPFKPWEGEWEGEIRESAGEGAAPRVFRQKRSYRHVLHGKEFRQEGHFETTDSAAGKTIREGRLHSSDFKGTWLRLKEVPPGLPPVLYAGTAEGGRIRWSRLPPGTPGDAMEEWIEGDVLRFQSGPPGGPVRAEGEFHRRTGGAGPASAASPQGKEAQP